MAMSHGQMHADSSADSAAILYEALEAYPWASDKEFEAGLAAILGPHPQTSAPEQIEDLTLRARCFYYDRCAAALDQGRRPVAH